MGTSIGDGVERQEKNRLRRLIALVLVVVIVLASMSIIIRVIGPEGIHRDRNANPPNEPYDIYVTGEEAWTGLNMMMTRPVVIQPGASLVIRNSDLVVRMEDMVLDSFLQGDRLMPWFNVRDGASLTIVDSNVSLVADPRLETAVVLRDHSAFMQTYPVSLSRVVNLVEAIAPALSLEVQWRQDGDRLKVAAQEEPGKIPRILTTLKPLKGELMTWVRYHVPLEALVGGSPRLLIYPDPGYHTMVSDLRVMDGEGPLYGEMPWTGCAALDGWRLRGFSAFFELVNRPSGFEELIEVRGDLRLERTHLEGPQNILRKYLGSEIGDSKYGLLEADPYYRNVATSPKGGDIYASHSNVTIIGGRIGHVPISMEHSVLHTSGTTFEGDGGLLTLYNSTAMVEGAGFLSLPWEPSNILRRMAKYERESQSKALGISGQGTAGPSLLKDCAFRDFEMAVEVTRSDLAIEGCTFSGIGTLAIWDHEAIGLGSPEQLLSGNTFTDNPGHLFLRTHDAAFEVIEEWRDEESDYYHLDGHITNGDELGSPPIELLLPSTREARMFMPEVMVDANGTIFEPSVVRLNLSSEYCGPSEVEVNTTDRFGTVFLPFVYPSTGVGPDWKDLVEISHWLETGNSTGEVAVAISVEAWNVFLNDVELEVSRDGVPMGLFDVPWDPEADTFFEEEYGYYTKEIVQLEEGISTLDLTLRASINESETMETVWSMTWDLLRVTGPEKGPEVVDYLAEGGMVVVLDPDVELTLSRVEGCMTWAEYTDGLIVDFVVLAYEGACLDMSFDPVPEGLNLSIGKKGEGKMVLRDSDISLLLMCTRGSVVELVNLSIVELEIFIEEGDLVCHDSVIYWTFLHSSGNSTITMERVDMDMEESELLLPFGRGYNIKMVDCRLHSSSQYHLWVPIWSNSTLDLEGCTIENVTLDIDINTDEPDWYLNVSGCEFFGSSPGLSLMPWGKHYLGPGPAGPVVNLEGNRFVGEGTDLVLSNQLARYLFGKNELVAGARLVTWYPLDYNLSGEARREVTGCIFTDIIKEWPYEPMYDHYVPWGAFVDVTTDVDRIDNPGTLWIEIRERDAIWWVDGDLIWTCAFARVQPGPDPIRVEVPDWELADDVVYTILMNKPSLYEGPEEPPSWWEG